MLFVALSLVTGVLYCVVTPPFQVPDEWNHFYRAWAISEGQFQPIRHDGGVGFLLPPEIPALAESLAADVVFGQRRHVDPTRIRNAVDAAQAGEARVFVNTPTTAYLTSLIYAPQAAGIALGRLFALSPLQCLYLARLMNLLVGTALIAATLRVEPWRPWLLSLVALAPMASSLRASASPDVVTLGVAFWLIAKIASLVLVRDAVASRRDLLTILGGTALLCPMKIVYAPLALAAWLIPERAFVSRAAAWRFRLLQATIVVALGVCASSRAASLWVPFRTDVATNPSEQFAIVLADPIRFCALVAADFLEFGPRYLAQMVGQLGWLAVNLPKPLVAIYVLVALVIWWLETRVVLEPRRWLIVAGLVASSLLATSLSQYLVWTETGAQLIDGMQGRYLLPLVPLAAWLMPLRCPRTEHSRLLLPTLTIAIVLLATAVALVEIVARYYPHGFELLL